MAITITRTQPKTTQQPDGRRLVEWHLVMTDANTTDEVELDSSHGFYAPCDLVLVEATLGPLGAASTIRLQSGYTTGFALASNDAIGEASAAAVNNRLAADGDGHRITIPARASKLVLRPSPDVYTAGGVITLDVTIMIPGR